MHPYSDIVTSVDSHSHALDYDTHMNTIENDRLPNEPRFYCHFKQCSIFHAFNWQSFNLHLAMSRAFAFPTPHNQSNDPLKIDRKFP